MSNIACDFEGRTVVVTGAARGIGRGIAAVFAAARADVVVVDCDADELHEAADDLDATAAVADVSSTADVERVIADAVSRTGRVDVMVNNAGICATRCSGSSATTTGTQS